MTWLICGKNTNGITEFTNLLIFYKGFPQIHPNPYTRSCAG